MDGSENPGSPAGIEGDGGVGHSPMSRAQSDGEPCSECTLHFLDRQLHPHDKGTRLQG